MTADANNSSPNSEPVKGTVWTLAALRADDPDEEKRRQRREYRQYLARMQMLADLKKFSFELFDYEPHLVAKEFVHTRAARL